MLFWEDKPDHRIFSVAYNLGKKFGKDRVILISKDIKLRLKARGVGIRAEDYETGKVKSIDDLYKGKHVIEGVDETLVDDFYRDGFVPLERLNIQTEPYPNEYFIRAKRGPRPPNPTVHRCTGDPQGVYYMTTGPMPGLPMKPNEIRQAIDRLPTLKEKIDYLEAFPEGRGSHFARYTLASLYLEEGNTGQAESVLRGDIGSGGESCDLYESYSLLAGLYMDQKKEIPADEIGEMVASFIAMRKNAERARARDADRGGRKARILKEQAVKPGGKGGKAQKLRVFMKDPYQLERMLGDYYYDRGEIERALGFYESYYGDLDKPVETFVPESMRRYADILLKMGKTAETLYFVGYIVAFKPYMLDDLLGFADLYYKINDKISALLILLFTHTLSDGYSDTHTARCRELVEKLGSEMTFEPVGSTARKLAESCLAGERIPEMLRLIEGLKKEGIRNFFFSYLEGLSYFAREEYAKALTLFDEFNETYPFLAESHYYALVCMFKTDPEGNSRGIVSSAEKAIELKPGCALAEMARVYLGTTLGIPMNESPKLLISSEIGAIMNGFLLKEAPVKVLDKLIASLTIRENPYQLALVQLMSRVSTRRTELVTYLRNVCDLLNERGKNNVSRILDALSQRPPR